MRGRGPSTGVGISGGTPGSHPSASSTNGSAPSAVVGSTLLAPIRSRGRCAAPNGTVMVNVLPRPSVLSAFTPPPCMLASS